MPPTPAALPLRGAALDPVAERAAAGDRDATVLLLRGLEGLLVTIARRVARPWGGLAQEDLEDLVGEARALVLTYAPHYDRSKGAATTYFGRVVDMGLRRPLAVLLLHGFHVPAGTFERGREDPDVKRALCPKVPVGTGEGQVNDGGATGIDPADLRASIDRDRLEEQEFLAAAVHSALEHLTAVERSVLEARYGLNGGTPETLATIGVRYGRSRTAARQMEARALERVRRALVGAG